jgi:prolyl-tRNA synthetase
MIGAIIMVHGDDSGLVLPPRIAPVQVMVMPIAQKKEGVLAHSYEVLEKLLAGGVRAKVDDSDKSPGWKFSEQEMRGIPIRVELGPKDIEQGQAVLVRRDTREKVVVALSEVTEKVQELLKAIQKDMLERARMHREEHTFEAGDYETFRKTVDEKPGFVKAMWCGGQECEDRIKEDTGATSRCVPFDQNKIGETCVCCGQKAVEMVYWGKAY